MKFCGYELQQLLDKLDISEVIGFSLRYKDSDGQEGILTLKDNDMESEE